MTLKERLETLFEEASGEFLVHTTPKLSFVMYRGIKISKTKDGHLLQDTRRGSFYVKLSRSDYKKLQKFGFIEGVDRINFIDNQKKVAYYTKRAQKLYSKINRANRELPKNKRLNEKRIRTANENLDDVLNELIFYNNKVTQFNNKYNEENKDKTRASEGL